MSEATSVEVLASLGEVPTLLAVDDAWVYAASASRVWRVASSGGRAEVVAEATIVTYLAASGGEVFWADVEGSPAGRAGRWTLRARAKSGGDARVVASLSGLRFDQAAGVTVAVGAGGVFFRAPGGKGALCRADASGRGETEALLEPAPALFGMAASEDGVFYVAQKRERGRAEYRVTFLARAGGRPRAVSGVLAAPPAGLACAGGAAYWSEVDRATGGVSVWALRPGDAEATRVAGATAARGPGELVAAYARAVGAGGAPSVDPAALMQDYLAMVQAATASAPSSTPWGATRSPGAARGAPGRIAVHARAVAWTEGDAIVVRPLADGAREVRVPAGASVIALDAQRVYWPDPAGCSVRVARWA